MKRGQGISPALVLARVLDQGPDAVMSRGEAAAVIAARVVQPGESVRAARNRVGMQLDRSRNRSTDVTRNGLAALPEGGFLADEISRWGRREYPGQFDDLPIKARVVLERISETIRVTASPSAEVLPGTIERCHTLIQSLQAELAKAIEKFEQAEIERRHELGERFKRGTK